MNSLQIRQLVIIRVDADAEKEARVPPVDDLVVAELNEVGLVFLVAGCDQAVYLLQEGQRLSMGAAQGSDAVFGGLAAERGAQL